jgi:hypothetical protein
MRRAKESSSPDAAIAELLRQVAREELSFAADDVRRLSTLELPAGPMLEMTGLILAGKRSPTNNWLAMTDRSPRMCHDEPEWIPT